MTNMITKLALVGALLVSTLSAASAQSFNGSRDNDSAYSHQMQKDRASDSGNGGGGA